MRSVIRAGDLRERITIQRRAAGRDGLGQPSGAWADVATVWAKAESPRAGSEQFAAGQMQAVLPVTFTIRQRSDITIDETCRVVWRGVNHEITSPPVPIGGQGHREGLELVCVRGIRDGR